MEIEDTLTIVTPEGLQLRVTLAGAGSRAVQLAIDTLLQLGLVLAVLIIDSVIGGLGALTIVAVFAAYFLYWIAFEVLGGGRTPGMRLTRLRVVRSSGAPVDLPASAVRTLLRLIDGQPAFTYLVALIAVLSTKRNQRLGDLAAGTLIVREPSLPAYAAAVGSVPAGAVRYGASAAALAGEGSQLSMHGHAATPPPAGAAAAGSPWSVAAPAAVPGAGWDISAVSAEEVAAVEHFLARRLLLAPAARRALALRLEQALRARVAGAPQFADPERFLEVFAQMKAGR